MLWIHYNHTYRFCMKSCLQVNITIMATKPKFKVMSDKFNIERLCTSEVSSFRTDKIIIIIIVLIIIIIIIIIFGTYNCKQ
jgi:uncharacterized Rmd1/YagE family protein